MCYLFALDLCADRLWRLPAESIRSNLSDGRSSQLAAAVRNPAIGLLRPISTAYDAPMTRESHGSPAAGEPAPPSTLINGHDRHRRKTQAVSERHRQPTMDPDRRRKTQATNDGPRPSANVTDPQRWPQCAAFTHSTGAAASRMTFWIVDPSRNLPTGVRFLVPSTISSAPTSVAVSRICSAGSYSLPSVSTRNSTSDLLR